MRVYYRPIIDALCPVIRPLVQLCIELVLSVFKQGGELQRLCCIEKLKDDAAKVFRNLYDSKSN